MVDLVAKSPCEGLLPLTIGTVTVTEDLPGAMTSLAPFKGREKELSEALKRTHGMGFPAPGRSSGRPARGLSGSRKGRRC